MKISAVIVSWNVRDLLVRCVQSTLSEARAAGHEIEVIVVDNASSDGSPGWIAATFPDIRLIANTENRGFSAACNQAIAVASGEALLLLNPDAQLLPGALAVLAEGLLRDASICATGPMLLNPDGSVQPSRRRFPTLMTGLMESTIVQDHFPTLPHLRRYYRLDVSPEVEQEVDWLTGACLLLRRSALDEVGGFDERFFMYFEEADWFLRARRAGYRVRYLPAARALHQEGSSSGQDLPARHLRFLRSKSAYYSKHYGPAVGNLLRLLLMADCVLRAAEDTLKLLLGHRVAYRRQRIALLLSVVQRALRA